MDQATGQQWQDGFYAAWRLYLAALERQSAAIKALFGGGKQDELVESPGVGPAARPYNRCQALVQDLFQEAKIQSHGAVPVVTRQAWLEAIEGCKGKIPESEYDEALAILRAPVPPPGM